MGGLLASAALLGGGCAREAPPRATSCSWLAGRLEPAFDPTGPPDPVRWSLERLLTRGLVEEDSGGAVRPAGAERWEWSADSLALTLHLRPGLRFADGSPCGSEDFRRALLSGLAATSHGSKAWLLGSLSGVERVRAGKPLPVIGVETPDSGTIRLRLARRDPALLRKLTLPGVSAAWSRASGERWSAAAGLGPYRVLREEPGRVLTLLRRGTEPGPDTITVRFQPVTSRVLPFLRGARVDLVWPLPSGVNAATVPPGYRLVTRPATPARWLLLVMRADLPPTSRLPTRHALAHAVNRDRLLDVLGLLGRGVEEWLPGAGRYEFPALDEGQVREWMARAKLGQAFHVVLAYDADGPAARVARVLQGEWSSLGIYAELRPLRGARLGAEMLAGLSHLALVEAQPWTDDLPGSLSLMVMPLRGPAVGAFRTGWRTREFDAWLAPGRGPAPIAAGAVQARLREELVALPLAELPWAWIARDDAPPPSFHPHYGPGCPVPLASSPGTSGP